MVTTTLLLRVQEQPPPAPGGSTFLFMIIAWVVIAYFFFIRPGRVREREHKEKLSQLRKHDEVITAGGIVGKIVHLADDRVTIKTDESRLVILRSRIADIVSDQPAEDDKK